MTEFDDLKFKPILDRLMIRIKQDDKTINSWKLTDFLQEFASSYYKVDLLHSILKALNSGINPKNIVIFDRTIDYKYNDYDFYKLNLSENIYDIYKVGSPVSIYPNIKIYELYLIFKLYFDLNNIMKDLGRILISQNYQEVIRLYWLKEYYKSFKTQEFIPTVTKLVSTAISQIPDNALGFKTLIREQEDITIKKYQGYLRDSPGFNDVTKNLNINNNINLGHYEKYFTDFVSHFKKISRPVVAIFRPEDESFEFLCTYHFNSKIDNPLLFKIDEITHRSPFIICITIAGWILAPLIKYQIDKMIENMDTNKKHAILEIEEKRLEKILKMSKGLYQNNMGIEFESLESKYLSNSLNSLLVFINEDFTKMFDIYSFGIVDIEEK
jgi:hypothetical protein